MRKLIVAVLSVAVVFAFAGSASALTWALAPADIYAAGGLDVVIPNVPDLTSLSSIADPFGGNISFTGNVEKRSVPGTWSTWSHGYTGPVLSSNFAQTVRLDFDCSVGAFGFYAEPNTFDLFDVTLGLDDGSSITKQVQGQAGAEFFGFYGGHVDWLAISTTDVGGFAFSEMTMACVPEPATLMLLGSGLLGLGLMRRRK